MPGELLLSGWGPPGVSAGGNSAGLTGMGALGQSCTGEGVWSGSWGTGGAELGREGVGGTQ